MEGNEDSNIDTIVACLERHDTPVRKTTIWQETEIPDDELANALRLGIERGRFEDLGRGTFASLKIAAARRGTPILEAIVSILGRHESAISQTEIKSELKKLYVGVEAIQKALKKGVSDRHIVKLGRGLYGLPNRTAD